MPEGVSHNNRVWSANFEAVEPRACKRMCPNYHRLEELKCQEKKILG